MKEKYCNKCETTQDINNFHKDKYKPDGHTNHCKICKAKIGEILRQEKRNAKARIKKNILPKSKIECLRGGKQIILKKDCIPGCNDACQYCTNRQEKNIKAGGDTLSKEEETQIRYEGVGGSGYGDMIEIHAEI